MTVTDRIAKILAGSSPEAPLRSLLDSFFSKGDHTSFAAAFTYFANERTSSSILGATVASLLSKIELLPNAGQKVDFLKGILPYLRAISSFSDEAARLDPIYISACQSANRYEDLAIYLQSKEFDESTVVGDEAFLDHYIPIAEAWINAGLPDSQGLMTACRKAIPHFFARATSRDMNIRFRKVRAAYWISMGDFLKAARDYVTIANIARSGQEQFLRLAIVYVLLAPRDQNCAQLSAELLSDERVEGVPLSRFLRRLSKASLLGEVEIGQLSAELKNERGFDPAAIQKLVVSHNLATISKFCKSVSFNSLAAMLAVEKNAVVKQLRDGIASRLFQAVIDQPAEIVIFKHTVSAQETRDQRIETFARAVQDVGRELP